MVKATNGLRTDSSDYRTELLSPAALALAGIARELPSEPSWRLSMDGFKLPERQMNSQFGLGYLIKSLRRQRKISEYYKRQDKLLKGFNEVDSLPEFGIFPGTLTEEEMNELERSERSAIYASNIANLILFVAKVYASVQSRSLAVIASTLDSLLDLLSGFILWFTAYAMRKPNEVGYPIGKSRMQPVGIVVFASVMATLGLQVLFESGRELVTKTQPERDPVKEKWMIGIMVSATAVKFVLMLYCRRFKNEIVRAYAQDHFFDVITNSIGLAAAVLAIKFYWWIDPLGAILVKHIETVRAYKFGCNYFVEVHVVLPGEMSLSHAHAIGETLQDKIEKLPEVDRAFVHVDFDITHKPEHKPKLVP
ncbi:Metal tolerance protein 10 [Morus notabilis]|uniref:MTP9 protein n=1 Tax=Morus notabilis TaxID=981085 RepID=W9RNS1_9ROSA|nr:MTP9 protein [Morus notabilis]EXB62630.1 Metal tolerance protein 10 [Morus notabilis]